MRSPTILLCLYLLFINWEGEKKKHQKGCRFGANYPCLFIQTHPLGFPTDPSECQRRFAAREEKKINNKKKHNSNETSRKEMDDFQISCKEKREEVTGMGKGIKGQGWEGRGGGGGLTERRGENLHTMERQGRGGKGALMGGEESRGK